MDPVTITATVITFATAVKDLVELGQKIHESFAQVSKNRRSAQRAAENVKDMIDEIGAFCEEHKDTIANMKEFTAALDVLLKKLRLFETLILPLVPQRGGSWISVAFLRGWWNNNKVKDSILDLEGEIREVRRRYVMKSAMRTEVRLEVVHQDAARGFAEISHGLELVRTDVHAMRVSTTTAPIAATTLAISDERERNILLFVRSAMSKSTSLLRPPDDVTEEVWTTVFIRSQIRYIEADVAKISTLSVFTQSNADQLSLRHVLAPYKSMEISCLRRDVVRKLMDLRDVLSNFEGLQATSVNRAAEKLSNISMQLSALGLGQESDLFLDWTIKLARALVNTPGRRGEAQHRACLAIYLDRLSGVCRDKTRCREAVEESLSIAEDLLSRNCTDMQIQGLCVQILLQYAQYAPDNESAINRCIQAIQHLEGIFDVETLVRVDSNGATGAVMNPSYDLVSHVFSSSPQTMMISRCADAFRALAVYMRRAGKSDNAKRLARLCIALQRQMVSVHGDAHRAHLAITLSAICQGGLAKCFAHVELLDMVDECAHLFRQLTKINPVYYSQRLLSILLRRADILDLLNRYSDSISTREEAVSMARQLTQDFKLQANALFRLAQGLHNAKRYLEAFRAMTRIPAVLWDESHASVYARLSQDLIGTRHYRESAEAANHCLAIYRSLALQCSEVQWLSGTIRAHCALAQSLISLGNEAHGNHILKEAMTTAANLLTASSSNSLPTKLHIYLRPFKVGLNIHNSIDDNRRIHLLEGLVTRYPQNKEIFEALSDSQGSHAYHLYSQGRLREALDYINKWNNSWDTGPHFTSKLAWLLARMVWIKTKTLSAQGDILQARSGLQSHRLASELCSCSYWVLMSAAHEAQLEVAIGDWQKGLEVCKQVLEHSRSYPGDYQWRTIMALHAVAYAALHGRNYQLTMEAAREGIAFSADPDWQLNEQEGDISIRPSLFAMMSSAEANSGNLDRAMDYAQQAVTLSLDIAELKHKISSTTAKHSLVETRGYLAEVLLATGDLTQAHQICDERRAYFAERVKDRMGEWRDLAPILRMLGVLCCHEGRHEEGEAAARELSEIIQRLGLVFPSLQEQVEIQLRYQASVPILKVLDEMTEKLDCEHQKGITALFKD